REVLGASEIRFNPELEVYVFDDVRYQTTSNRSFYEVDSREAIWNTGADERPNLAFKIPPRDGHYGTPPRDRFFRLRQEIVNALEAAGIKVRYHHHEAGGPGQAEIELSFDSLLKSADHIQVAKYMIRNIAVSHGKTATFMPKPLFDEAGSGMHLHVYPLKGSKSLFYGPGGYGCLNSTARQFIAGLLKHTPALMAITNPTTNSYRRFGRGMAAPLSLFFSLGNRSAAVRIPGYARGEEDARIEYRVPDPSCNPYLCLAGVVMAGVDGVKKGLSPEEEGFGPYDVDAYRLSDEELSRMKAIPSSLEDALEALRVDNDFLREGGVFDPDFVGVWVGLKLKNEVFAVSVRPHPYEFYLYYDR
ncbi:MAG: glutamine synthetase, partial [Firmicutes bacterium]|nr:glutamine synthetase [Bacillota bacterium]